MVKSSSVSQMKASDSNSYVYMLRCNDGSLYTGWTNDISRRVIAHQMGKGAKYTKAHLPVTLVYVETCPDKSSGMKREYKIKQLSKHEKELLVTSDLNDIKLKKGDKKMNYGIQMFSVRDITEKDLKGALEKLAALGYKGIEFAGFFGNSAEDVKSWLDANGLYVSGSHSSLQDLVEKYDETVAYHKALGNKNYIIPYAKFETEEDLEYFVKNVNEIQPKLEKEGIALSYHNHSGEFKVSKAGYVPFDEMVAKTNIGLEIDTFWAYAAGKCPVCLMEENKDRLKFIHIKDGFEDGKGMPLGLGTAPVKDVYNKAVELGVPMVVESETLTPDGMTEAEVCIKFLKEQEA